MPDETPSYAKQQLGESRAEWTWFTFWRDLPEDQRTLKAVAENFHIALQTVKNASSANRWATRRAVLDEAIDDMRMRKIMALHKRSAEREAIAIDRGLELTVKMLVRKLEQFDKDPEAHDTSLPSLVQTIESLIRASRLDRGLPSSRIAVEHAKSDPAGDLLNALKKYRQPADQPQA
jgi:hypothetical protein